MRSLKVHSCYNGHDMSKIGAAYDASDNSVVIFDGVGTASAIGWVEVPMKRAHWVKNIRGDYCCVCDNCLYGFPNNGIAWMDCNRESDDRQTGFNIADIRNYCPNCGAKMEVDG